MFTLAVFEVLLFESRPILASSQLGAESKRVKGSMPARERWTYKLAFDIQAIYFEKNSGCSIFYEYFTWFTGFFFKPVGW